MIPKYSTEYSSFEKEHWWFKARRVILRTILAQSIPWRAGIPVLEIGVGPGENLYSLYPPSAQITGLEPDPTNAALAAQRGTIPVVQGTVADIPRLFQPMQFEVICLLDVLEHLPDPEAALRIIHAAMAPGGHLVLTMPAYQWLWGPQDIVNQHYCRYTLARARAELGRAGWSVVRGTYFNTLLFPFIAAWRLFPFRKQRRYQQHISDFELGARWMNSTLYRLFASEACWLRRHRLAFGVSCLVIAKK